MRPSGPDDSSNDHQVERHDHRGYRDDSKGDAEKSFLEALGARPGEGHECGVSERDAHQAPEQSEAFLQHDSSLAGKGYNNQVLILNYNTT